MILKMPEDPNPKNNFTLVDDKSFIDPKVALEELKEAGYDDLPIESVPEMSKDEFSDSLLAEGKLRKQLNAINNGPEHLFYKDPEFVAAYIKERGLQDVALAWLDIHLKNKAIAIKRGDASIMIFPTTITIMKAAKILRGDTTSK